MKRVVILSGAGMSAESGIKTFRDSNGLWEGHDVTEVATPEGFAENPRLVQQFYNARRKQLFEVEPNTGHKALARLEQSDQYEVTVITQNVDDLHERAGSDKVWHMHGQLRKKRCTACGQISEQLEDLEVSDRCELCKAPGSLRPDIVWFGEVPYHLNMIEEVLKQADLFICIGTSGVVYPAASFVSVANDSCAGTIEINPEVTAISQHFDETRKGKAGEEVTKLVDELLNF